jgi:hypothetical protein
MIIYIFRLFLEYMSKPFKFMENIYIGERLISSELVKRFVVFNIRIYWNHSGHYLAIRKLEEDR